MFLTDIIAIVSLVVGISSIMLSIYVWRVFVNLEKKIKENIDKINKNSIVMKESMDVNSEKILIAINNLSSQVSSPNKIEKENMTKSLSNALKELISDPKVLATIGTLLKNAIFKK